MLIRGADSIKKEKEKNVVTMPLLRIDFDIIQIQFLFFNLIISFAGI